MKRLITGTLIGVSLFAVGGGAAQAGVLSYSTFTTDAGALPNGTSVTYTHHVDTTGGFTQTAPLINNVQFDNGGAGANPTLNYTLNNTGVFPNNNDPSTGAAGAAGAGIHALLTNFNYGTPTTLQLTGLTAGTTYTTRFFISSTFEGAGFNFTSDDGSGTATNAAVGDTSLPIFDPAATTPAAVLADQVSTTHLDRGNPSPSAAGEYDYTFTSLGTAVNFSMTASNGQDGFHTYGFSNEVVPEPASLGLIGIAGLGLLGRRRKA